MKIQSRWERVEGSPRLIRSSFLRRTCGKKRVYTRQDGVSIVHPEKFSFLFTTALYYQVMDALNGLFHEDYKLNFLILLFLPFSVEDSPSSTEAIEAFSVQEQQDPCLRVSLWWGSGHTALKYGTWTYWIFLAEGVQGNGRTEVTLTFFPSVLKQVIKILRKEVSSLHPEERSVFISKGKGMPWRIPTNRIC